MKRSRCITRNRRRSDGSLGVRFAGDENAGAAASASDRDLGGGTRHHGAAVRFPFPMLHREQSVLRLLRTVKPPFEKGTM